MSNQNKLITAYLWNIFGKWGTRFIGIGSTLILVRLIEPASFGLVAIAALCIGFFEILQNIGVNRYLISQTELNTSEMNSSWTLSLLLKFLVSIAIFLTSPFISDFFDKPQLELIIKLIAVNNIFSGFNNIGLVRYEKELNFRKITYLGLFTKVFSTLTTVLVAFFHPNHWALIAGGASALWVNLIGSYIICPYRPKINFRFNKQQFSFSFLMIIRSMIAYSRNKFDTFIVSKIFNIDSVGKYKIGQDFAVMPFSQIISPAGAVMFPSMAQYKNDKAVLFDKTYRYLALIYMLIIPSVVGIWFIAPQFCTVILGEKWADTAPIMASLSILMISYPANSITTNLYDCLGKTNISIFNDLFGLILLISISGLVAFDNIEHFSELRGYIAITSFFFIIFFAKMTINLSIFKMIEVLTPSFLSASFMYFILSEVYFNDSISLLGLFFNITVGASSYAICLLLVINFFKTYSDIWNFWNNKIIDYSSSFKRKVVNIND
ncbi:oligosaccharide flippase family protein [Photobacterium sp. BZF1]|uniref:oligosaccharide flippase family protein n=1 Tax=Photobacterium sp. BZF1 TaxID=1904457 RepID=UPI0016536C6E|nr:oligosaccharide flippase family protein [Photobacterium sp. BZF1]MBC7004153.1 oligosaccharide flippase family protein [Photobacterium sp. BZF1]